MLLRPADLDDPAVASALDELSLWSSRFGALLLDEMPIAPGLCVLDLGCGCGFPTFELAHVLGPTGRVIGIDLWAAGLARAARKARVYALANTHLVRGDATRLPFRDAGFDLVVSNLGINNFADLEGVLGEAARVTRPGARIALTTNAKGHMQELYEAYRHVLQEMDREDALARLTAEEDHRFTAEHIEERLAKAGFHVLHVVSREFTLRYADGKAFLRHALIRAGFLEAWRAVAGRENEERVFERLERTLDDLARADGELRMTVPMLYVDAVREGA